MFFVWKSNDVLPLEIEKNSDVYLCDMISDTHYNKTRPI